MTAQAQVLTSAILQALNDTSQNLEYPTCLTKLITILILGFLFMEVGARDFKPYCSLLGGKRTQGRALNIGHDGILEKTGSLSFLFLHPGDFCLSNSQLLQQA